MKLLPPEVIDISEEMLARVDETVKSIYRLIIFNRQHQGSNLLARYLEAMEHLRDVLSIKNAQQEAQSVEEAAEYLGNLKESIKLIVAEIADHQTLSKPVDLFRLFRIIAPDVAARLPNHYRQTHVQFGPCFGAAPAAVPALVDQLFHYLAEIKHPVLRAIYLHHELVRIHPFTDGNGRLSRMAMNWLLMHELYPPMFISDPSDKKNYVGKLQASFLALQQTPYTFHAETKAFFEDELRRMRASAHFVLHRMLKNPTITFDDRHRDEKSATSEPRMSDSSPAWVI